MIKTKTLMIGWDGATFDIIMPMIDKSRLPHIASLMHDGVWGRLESTIPPLTPVAWTSLSTGVNPGKHGIFDAMMYMREGKKTIFVNSTLRKVKPIWKILSDNGCQVGVMNVPVTYPPDTVNGFVVPGMFTPGGAENIIYPDDVKSELKKKFGHYQIECAQIKNPSAYLDSIIKMVDLREKVALHLMGKYSLDFFFVAFMASDRAQHFYWKYLNSSHPEHNKFGDAIAKVYERMDQALGRLLEKSGPDTNVIMASDHGAGPLKSAFFLNNWLIINGYLKLKKNPSTVFRAKKFPHLKRALSASVKKIMNDFIPCKIKSSNYGVHDSKLDLFNSLIDWDNTVAFSEGVAGGIYLNRNKVQVEQQDILLSKIKEELEGLVDERNGNKVIEKVNVSSEIYTGEFVKFSPDLIPICSETYQIIAPNELIYFGKDYSHALFMDHRWSGRHEHDGIFVINGPNVKSGQKINGCNIVDISPTILYLRNEDVPSYFDGKVLVEALDSDYVKNNPIKYTSSLDFQQNVDTHFSAEDEIEISERLKSLGYIE